MHQLSFATPDELKLEVVLAPGATPCVTDAATIHLLFSEASLGVSLPEAYEHFRIKACEHFKCEVNSTMAYLLVETAIRITNKVKKNHTTDTASKPSA